MSELALFGGPKAITKDPGDLFKWPIITKEDEDAVLDVLRSGSMSGTDVTREFEKEFAAWQGLDLALGFSTGTAAIQSAMFGCKVGVGDEIICPTVTYWASGLQAFTLGATVVFANVDPDTLCIDPNDIEHRIGPRTKAIVVVHYTGHPADMDPIMAIAKKHGIKVIEDVSHAHGGLYKGKMVGTFGDVAAMSLMSGKSLAIGEAGILATNDREIYERAIAFGHYSRYRAEDMETESLKAHAGLPMGGYKYRMHQMSSAVGRVQLRHYNDRMLEIRKGMNYFWDLLEGVPGIKAHRVDEKTGSTMGGWYAPKGLYKSEELGGLSVTRFCEAVRAEGFDGCSPGCNLALHTHSLFQTLDVYGHGKPTRIANADRDVRELDKTLAPSEEIGAKSYSIPWFKHFEPEKIEEYAKAFKKVAMNYKELLKDDPGNPAEIGGWHFFQHSPKK
ncbi:MAG TPA: DegT/DnrJ/EryC1/StrS family aminotransferase [Clostridia bacterium]|nr:DegT/DnrJ/EryC1/StrS family aminotransferase [Clostridia bacterium]